MMLAGPFLARVVVLVLPEFLLSAMYVVLN